MAQFDFTTVSGAEQVRGQCSLAIDKNGKPWIACALKGGTVMVARKDGGAWVREQPNVPLASSDEDVVQLRVDSAGQPHLGYIEGDTRRLVHAMRKPDSTWTYEHVPTHVAPHQPIVFGASFALHPGAPTSPDLRDTPHFAFENQALETLSYVRRIGGTWKLSHAAEAQHFGDAGNSRTGQSTSLCFDESGGLQIAYVETYEVVPTTVVHVKRVLNVVEGTFGDERDVEKGQFFVGRTSVISQTPQTWVAYCDVKNLDLKAGTFTSDGVGDVEVVESVTARTVPVLAQNPAIGGELSRRLRIAYADDGKIKLASRSVFGWTVGVVDPAGGTMPGLAYDNQGKAHLAYAVGQTLRYAVEG
ncbi:hypothetical protein [Streptomyces neyagawaensis]|uniref:Uncharacterized protein n=1 Tax=Streptomyces neyagawaensis TaxID=42238 RepID=A0ABV3BBY0_9ACTN